VGGYIDPMSWPDIANGSEKFTLQKAELSTFRNVYNIAINETKKFPKTDIFL